MPDHNPVHVAVETMMAAQKLSQSAVAQKTGIHRNFIIDILRGKVPRVRDGAKFADEDPRYAKLAAGLGLDVAPFVAMAKREQQRRARATPESEESRETGVKRTRTGGISVHISGSTLELTNVVLAFDIPEGRVTISIQPHPKP